MFLEASASLFENERSSGEHHGDDGELEDRTNDPEAVGEVSVGPGKIS